MVLLLTSLGLTRVVDEIKLTVNLEKCGTVGAIKTEGTHQQGGTDWPHWTVERKEGGRNQTQILENELVNSAPNLAHCKDISPGRVAGR